MSRQAQYSDSLAVLPSGYTGLSNLTTTTSYPITNAYTDTDSTTYARLSLSTSTTGYLYLTFDVDLPTGATVTGVSASCKVRVSSTSRVTSTVCQMYVGTTAKGSNTTFASTSTTNVVTLSTGSSWSNSDMSDLRMRIGGTGSSSSQSKYIYLYGAEVTITYEVDATEYEITVTNNTSATVSYDQWVMQGGDATVLADDLTGITVTDNGTDVTSQFTVHQGTAELTADLGTYELVSGSFNGSGATYFSGIVGNGADASVTTSNYYSGGSDTIAVFTYDMGVTVPSTATITRVWVEVSGHAESTSNSSEYMCAMLISGSTELSDELNFKDVGTSNTVQTIEATTLPTVAQCAAMQLQCRLGYYGGAINGATVHVEYTTGTDGYAYAIAAIAADHALVFAYESSGPTLYVKDGSSWVQVTKAYRKVSGTWQEVALDAAFSQGTRYRKG